MIIPPQPPVWDRRRGVTRADRTGHTQLLEHPRARVTHEVGTRLRPPGAFNRGGGWHGATGRLANRDGQVVVQAVREWLKAHEAGRVAERVEELREQVAALKKREGMKAVS